MSEQSRTAFQDDTRLITPRQAAPMAVRPIPTVTSSVANPVYVIQRGRPTSGAAVTGFVLALLGLGLPALVTSIVALRRTSTGELGGYGLAVAGIVIAALDTIVEMVFIIPILAVVLAALGSGAGS